MGISQVTKVSWRLALWSVYAGVVAGLVPKEGEEEVGTGFAGVTGYGTPAVGGKSPGT
jgi:hypothetical protein